MTAHDPEPLPGFKDPPTPAKGRLPVTCRMCGRPLRDRDARLWGLGPGCRHKLHTRSAPRPPSHEIQQDTLPGV
ncbi:DUF6011 domain-containing protein [Streptomyces sp. SAJ15]|uniref:DUF6011 domain-containing protein n=1 Tax=Streptomyces sp. SAJ15 TaxID=2011095 RepID=UPI0011868B0F|nr:DUF6011 domain-containing protein [Streptomyces sp. SAJ15]TVL89791.1 hypothetical protein CD790_25685 [Streptomyces sp. SAJ15]